MTNTFPFISRQRYWHSNSWCLHWADATVGKWLDRNSRYAATLGAKNQHNWLELKACNKCHPQISQPNFLSPMVIIREHLLVVSCWPSSWKVSYPHLHPTFQLHWMLLLKIKRSQQQSNPLQEKGSLPYTQHPWTPGSGEFPKQGLPIPVLMWFLWTVMWNGHCICCIAYKNQSQYVCCFKLIWLSLSTLLLYKNEKGRREK